MNDMEAFRDSLAQAHGTTRDPLAEGQANCLGRLLRVMVRDFDETSWARLSAWHRGLGPVERVTVWTHLVHAEPATFRGVFRPGEDEERRRCKALYDEFMSRAKAAHRHLSRLVVEAFGVSA